MKRRKALSLVLTLLALIVITVPNVSATGGSAITPQVITQGNRGVTIRTSAVWPLSDYVVEGSNDQSYPTYEEGAAIDENGSTYVIGFTQSTDITVTSGAYAESPPAATQYNIYIQKWATDGSNGIGSIIWGTYFGGASNDYGYAIAVDPDGNVHFTGYTESDNTTFPVTANAFWNWRRGNFDCFYAVLASNGSTLLYSTYFGGAGDEYAYDIALDGTGLVWICGATESYVDFPRDAVNYSMGVGIDTSWNGGTTDAFLAAFNYTGVTGRLSGFYSTFLGGAGEDSARSLVVSNHTVNGQEIGVCGLTDSSDFQQITTGAYDTVLDGTDSSWWVIDHRVRYTVLGLKGYLNYGTYLGAGIDQSTTKPYGWPRMSHDNVTDYYVVSGTVSGTYFPVSIRAPQKTVRGGTDGYLMWLDPRNSGSTDLRAATYWGNSSDEHVFGACVDDIGQVVLVGSTMSEDFIAVGERASSRSSAFRDSMVVRFSRATNLGTSVNYSSAISVGNYLWAEARDVVLDSRSRHVRVAGSVSPANTLISLSMTASYVLPTEPHFTVLDSNLASIDGPGDTLRLVGQADPSSDVLIGAPVDHVELILGHSNGTTQTLRGWLQDPEVSNIYEVNVTFLGKSNASIDFVARSRDYGEDYAIRSDAKAGGRITINTTLTETETETTTGVRSLTQYLEDYIYYIITALAIGFTLYLLMWARGADRRLLPIHFAVAPLVGLAVALLIPQIYSIPNPYQAWQVAAIIGFGAGWAFFARAVNTNKTEQEGFWGGLAAGMGILTYSNITTGGSIYWSIVFIVVAVGSILRAVRNRITVRLPGWKNIGTLVNVIGGIVSIILLVLPYVT